MAAKPKKKPVVIERTAVVILAMHRSGAELMTELFHLLGCDLATSTGPVPGAGNASKWENKAIRAFNNRLLASAGSNWSDWTPMPENWATSGNATEFAEALKELLRTEFAAKHCVVLNDPRIARIAGFWTSAIEDTGYTPHLVLALRNPLEVAGLLETRNKIDPSLSHLLWLRHVLEAELASRGRPRAVLHYGDLADNWASALTNACKRLKIKLPKSPAQIKEPAIVAVAAQTRENHCTVADVLDNPLMSDWVRETYRILLNWTTKAETKADHARLDKIRAQFDASTPTFAAIVQQYEGAQEQLRKRTKALDQAKSRNAKLIEKGEQDAESTRETQALQARVAQKLQQEIALEETRAITAETYSRQLMEELGVARDDLAKAQQDYAQSQSAMAQKAAELSDREAEIVQLKLGLDTAQDGHLRISHLEERLKDQQIGRDDLRRGIDIIENQLGKAESHIETMRTTHVVEVQRLQAEQKKIEAENAQRVEEIAKMSLIVRSVEEGNHQERAALQEEASASQKLAEEASARALRAVQEADAQIGLARQQAEESIAETARFTQDTLQKERDAAQQRIHDSEQKQRDLQTVATALLHSRNEGRFRTRRGQMKRDRAAVEKTGLFDPTYYANTNPDVIEAGHDPLTHFILYGLAEGRVPRMPTPDGMQ